MKMKMNRSMGLCAAGLCLAAQAVWAAEVEAGFRSLFNGADLTGWAGRPQHWSVQDGAITGTTTQETPAQGNNFLIARDGDKDLAVGDFELRCSFKFTGDWGNSGIQYRSRALPNFVVHGYQADMETGPNYSGILYEEGGRGILCERGQKVVIKDDPANPGKPKIEVVGSLGDAKQIGAAIDPHQWSDYVVIARGNHLQHFINGRQTVDVVDEHAAKAAQSGILALQLHGGPPMKIQFKNIRIKPLSAATPVSDSQRLQGTWQAESLVRDGETVPKADLAGARVRVEGNRFFIEGDADASEGTFDLVEGGLPKAMNVTTAGGDLARAIYEVTDDTLKVCYAADGGSRPSEFKSEAYSGRVLAVYRKAKAAKEEKPGSELERVQGTWQAESLVRDGEAVSKSDLAGLRVRIEGNRFFITGDENASEGTFELVEGPAPKAMNVTTAGGDLARAIYEVTENTLKVCYAADGGSRPTDFKSEAYSGRVLAVYRKAKSTN